MVKNVKLVLGGLMKMFKMNNNGLRTFTTTTTDNHKLLSVRIRQETPGNNLRICFGLIISPTLNFPSQLCIGSAKMPFMTPSISQLSLTPLISKLSLSFDKNDFFQVEISRKPSTCVCW